MLTDTQMFDCRSCAAAPQLQGVLGCFKKLAEPIAQLDGFDFYRCPTAHLHAGAHRCVELFRMGANEAPFDTKNQWPPKRLAGVQHVKYLMDLRNAQNE